MQRRSLQVGLEITWMEGISTMTRGGNSTARLFVFNLVVALVLLTLVGCGGDSPPKSETDGIEGH